MIEEKIETSGINTFYWHYAWVIVVIIAGMQIVGTSIRMAFGVFIDPLQNFCYSAKNKVDSTTDLRAFFESFRTL